MLEHSQETTSQERNPQDTFSQMRKLRHGLPLLIALVLALAVIIIAAILLRGIAGNIALPDFFRPFLMGLVVVLGLAALFVCYRVYDGLVYHQQQRERAREETRLLTTQREAAEKEQQHQHWLQTQTLLNQQQLEEQRIALERERVSLEREKLYFEAHIQQRRVLVPIDNTVVFVEPDGSYTPIYSPRTMKALSPAGQQDTTVQPSIPAPEQQALIKHLIPNSLTVSPGIRGSDGAVVVVNITEIPHLKIIGSSGFGKSCLAGALLDQVTTMNSPDLLQLALLDLEHKTSRIFENRPHVAELRVGSRRVSMVATNADEVAEHFGYLKKELDSRARLSEDDLERKPVLLMYVEEMLSLQYEVVDPKVLDQMLAHLTVLAVRGRKYRMFLLCCTQTDYSTDELRIAQKQFRFRAAGGIDLTAARAAGFMNTELIKQNFQHGQPGQGQFVVEYPSFSDIVLAPRWDWKEQLKNPVRERFTGPLTPPALPALNMPRTPSEHDTNTVRTNFEQAWEARLGEVSDLRVQGWGKIAIIEKVWRAKRGDNAAYRQAEAEYNEIIIELEEREQ